jgi:peptide/nickel transport system permease protein
MTTTPIPTRRSRPPIPFARPARTGRFSVGFWIASAFLAVVVIAAVAAPLVAPYDPEALDLANVLQPPSGAHLLGTDEGGRDTLSRLIWGARTGLLGPLMVVLISLVIGVPLGIIAARVGGILDTLVSRVTDLVLAFPVLLLSILAVALYGPSFTTIVLALGVAYIPSVARLARALTVQEQRKEYVNAYRVLGFGGMRVYGGHVLPNVSGVLFAQAVVHFGYALADLAVLSYLGFGVQPPDSDWGLLVQEGQQALLQGSPWQSVMSGVVIVVTVLAVNIVGVRLADMVGEEPVR